MTQIELNEIYKQAHEVAFEQMKRIHGSDVHYVITYKEVVLQLIAIHESIGKNEEEPS